MSVALRHPTRLTVDQYLAFEETASERHEFIDGVLYAMVGGSDAHNLIAGNLFVHLHNHLPDKCQVFEHGMKLRVMIDHAEHYYYPDVMVSCSETDRARHWRERPLLIAEVLSETTERNDRAEKFNAYRTIADLQEYVLIAQDVPQVEVFRRRNAWQLETLFMNDSLQLESVDLSLPVSRLYRRITF